MFQLKEFAIIPFSPRILSIEAVGEVEDGRHAIFIVAENGIFEVSLK